ncbi:hypothetical protein RZS08_61995, partial [Arthrospira platensis SPKY1]|nr:hypothetical protein [Arthrospira platensis SPKY1]
DDECRPDIAHPRIIKCSFNKGDRVRGALSEICARDRARRWCDHHRHGLESGDREGNLRPRGTRLVGVSR